MQHFGRVKWPDFQKMQYFCERILAKNVKNVRKMEILEHFCHVHFHRKSVILIDFPKFCNILFASILQLFCANKIILLYSQ